MKTLEEIAEEFLIRQGCQRMCCNDPENDGDYICRMDNAYIKLCHYKDGLWFDMWKGDIDRQVKEWMNIPYNK